MALIVEDGTGLANANSYNLVSEIRAYAEARGYDLPPEDGDVEKLAIQATDYTESFYDRYQGKMLTQTQALQWPRVGVTLYGVELDPATIPRQLKTAHAQATVEAYNSDLMPNETATLVKKEKVDVIEVEYIEATASEGKSSFTKIDSLLEPLFGNTGGWSLSSLRV
jgi:hypothetical protein